MTYYSSNSILNKKYQYNLHLKHNVEEEKNVFYFAADFYIYSFLHLSSWMQIFLIHCNYF